MSLTDMAIRTEKPEKSTKTTKAKPYYLKDGDGLFLQVHPRGSKYWHFRFSYSGKQDRISLGVYPEVGLKEARERRDKARELIAQGIDPRRQRRDEKRQQEYGNETFKKFCGPLAGISSEKRGGQGKEADKKYQRPAHWPPGTAKHPDSDSAGAKK